MTSTRECDLRRRSPAAVLVGVALVLTAAEPGQAGPPSPDDVLDDFLDGVVNAYNDDFEDVDEFSVVNIEAGDDGKYLATIEGRWGDEEDEVTLYDVTVTGDFDPFTEINGTFNNPTAGPVNFIWQTTMVTMPVSGAPWMGDASLEIELVDNNGDGVELTGVPPLFGGPAPPLLAVGLRSDEATPTTMLLSDLTVDATTLSGAGVYEFDPEPIFLPDPPAGAAWRQLLVASGFRLTAGDSAIIRARVDELVPEPGTLTLLAAGVGLVAMPRRRPRR